VADLLNRRCTIGRLALRFAKAEAFPYWSIVVETCACRMSFCCTPTGAPVSKMQKSRGNATTSEFRSYGNLYAIVNRRYSKQQTNDTARAYRLTAETFNANMYSARVLRSLRLAKMPFFREAPDAIPDAIEEDLASRARLAALSFSVCNLSSVGSLPSQQIWGQAVSSTLPLSPSDWTLAYSGQDASLSSVTYGGQPALEWQVSSPLGHSDWVYDTLPLPTDEMYTFSVELAGTGTAALNIWNGEENVTTQSIQLSSTFQTLSETVAVLSPDPQFQILDPDSTTSAVMFISLTRP